MYQKEDQDTTLLIFIEVVATSGSMIQERKNTILNLLCERGYDTSKVAFVTDFLTGQAEPIVKRIWKKSHGVHLFGLQTIHIIS